MPNDDGSLVTSASVPDASLVAEAHRHGVRVLLSLGGWGYDAQFAALVLNPAAETRFVDSVLRLIERGGYDGIDLDWEYPDSHEEVAGFERLTRRLRAGLDALAVRRERPMVLTMAAAANPATLAWLSNEFLLETMDWVNVMSYDYAGSWTPFAGHNAPFKPSSQAPRDGRQSVTTTFDYLLKERGLPADRLALGLPLYGRKFSVARPFAATEGTSRPGKSSTYRETRRLLADGWNREWDEETQTPWLLDPKGKAILGYDDAESIALKTSWARRSGLRGVFFWEISQDRMASGENPLQRAAKAAWQPASLLSP